tara:strand:- start:520 stop:828 length:309 start_codon:yes stop_codon:yes gene_type:complete
MAEATKEKNIESVVDNKFTEDEMKVVKEIQNKYVTIQHQFGQLSIARLRLEQQLSSLDETEENLSNDFVKTQEEESEFIKSVTEKYGDGILDPNTGIYKKES